VCVSPQGRCAHREFFVSVRPGFAFSREASVYIHLRTQAYGRLAPRRRRWQSLCAITCVECSHCAWERTQSFGFLLAPLRCQVLGAPGCCFRRNSDVNASSCAQYVRLGVSARQRAEGCARLESCINWCIMRFGHASQDAARSDFHTLGVAVSLFTLRSCYFFKSAGARWCKWVRRWSKCALWDAPEVRSCYTLLREY